MSVQTAWNVWSDSIIVNGLCSWLCQNCWRTSQLFISLLDLLIHLWQVVKLPGSNSGLDNSIVWDAKSFWDSLPCLEWYGLPFMSSNPCSTESLFETDPYSLPGWSWGRLLLGTSANTALMTSWYSLSSLDSWINSANFGFFATVLNTWTSLTSSSLGEKAGALDEASVWISLILSLSSRWRSANPKPFNLEASVTIRFSMMDQSTSPAC